MIFAECLRFRHAIDFSHIFITPLFISSQLRLYRHITITRIDYHCFITADTPFIAITVITPPRLRRYYFAADTPARLQLRHMPLMPLMPYCFHVFATLRLLFYCRAAIRFFRHATRVCLLLHMRALAL